MRKMIKQCRVLVFFLLVALLAAGYAEWSLSNIPGNFQRLWLPPAQVANQDNSQKDQADDPDGQSPGTGTADSGSSTNAGLRKYRDDLPALIEQWAGACENPSLYAISSGASIAPEDGAAVSATLYGIENDYYGIRSLNLIGGRLIHPDEFERGLRVAIVDESLAVALFQYAQPIDREITIAGQTYRIVGISRGGKQVGDKLDHRVYIPYRAVEKSNLSLTAVCLEASPVQGSGGWSAFQTGVKALGDTGTTISLAKEKMNASLPLRLLLVGAAMAFLLYSLRKLNQWSSAFYLRYRERLLTQYAIRLTGWLVGRGALLLLGYAICAFLFAQLFVVLIQPVYTFPEWIPAVLVEPKDISAAFWNVWQGMAEPITLRSHELLRISFFARIMAYACGVVALLSGALWGRLMGFGYKEKEPKPAAESKE